MRWVVSSAVGGALAPSLRSAQSGAFAIARHRTPYWVVVVLECGDWNRRFGIARSAGSVMG